MLGGVVLEILVFWLVRLVLFVARDILLVEEGNKMDEGNKVDEGILYVVAFCRRELLVFVFLLAKIFGLK